MIKMRDDSEFLIEDVLQMSHKIYHKEDFDNGDDMVKLTGGRKLKTKNPPFFRCELMQAKQLL